MNSILNGRNIVLFLKRTGRSSRGRVFRATFSHPLGKHSRYQEKIIAKLTPHVAEWKPGFKVARKTRPRELLDYAYHDLQSPGDEKLETLYYLMSVQQIDTIAGNALLPYFSQPYAMLHSGFNDSHVLWAYSFWARRWHDGHIGLCRRLLDKVLEEYPNRTCTTELMKTTDRYYREKRPENKLTAADVLREIESAFAGVPRPDPQLPLMDPMEESDSLRAMG